jgi:hypothetical protein
VSHIYVASPYAGDIEGNAEYARACCRWVLGLGHVPMAPHLELPQYVDEATERALGLAVAQERLLLCDGFWAFGRLSEGMVAEAGLAFAHGIKRLFFPRWVPILMEGEVMGKQRLIRSYTTEREVPLRRVANRHAPVSSLIDPGTHIEVFGLDARFYPGVWRLVSAASVTGYVSGYVHEDDLL